jgi:hypothetical protein
MNIIQFYRDGIPRPVGHLLQILHVLVNGLSGRRCRCPSGPSSTSPPRRCRSSGSRVIFAECQSINSCCCCFKSSFIVDLGGFEILEEGFELSFSQARIS